MRLRTLVAAGLGAGLAVAPALAEDGYRHGRVRFVEPGVTLQRATEVSAEEALANVPFLPGDRLWTDSAGRAEFQFPDGTVVRLDRRSKLDYAGHEEGESERIVLRLWSGSVLVRVRTRNFARFEVETPAGMVQALDRGIVRVDVEAGETRVSVYAGEAELDDGGQRVRLAAGERTYVRWGGKAEEPQRFDPNENDDFVRWDDMRESEDRWGARSSEYLPDELDPYAGELEANGTWRYGGDEGYVWTPQVPAGWQPYSNGQWEWTPYGWTWVPYEHWGWAPFHYGRWGFSASFGWYWSPGRTWGPAWVSWAVGGGYVGWCPLGRHDRPVAPWDHDRGHAVPRGGVGRHGPWNVVRQSDLGARDIVRRHVSAERIDPGVMRVADAAGLRPTRDAGSLREGGMAPRAITRRMSPGDFVRELGVDNKTTIPAPWTHGYGPPPAGVDGARYGVPRRTDRGEEDKPSRTWTTNRGTGTAAAPTSGAPSGSGGQSDSAASSRRAPRPVPWYTPRSTDDGSSGRGERAVPSPGDAARRRSGDDASRARPDAEGGVYRPRTSGGESSGGYYRPRANDGESSGGSRPRSGGEGSGSYRPRSSGSESSSGNRPRGGGSESSGGARARGNDGGGSHARPSGGSGGGSGSGHAAARPRGNRN